MTECVGGWLAWSWGNLASVGLSTIGFMVTAPVSGGDEVSGGAVAARVWLTAGGEGLIDKSAGGPFLPPIDLLDVCFLRYVPGASVPFVVVVIVLEEGIGGTFAAGIVGVGVGVTLSSGKESAGVMVLVVSVRVGGRTAGGGSSSSSSESSSAFPTKGEGGTIVTFG